MKNKICFSALILTALFLGGCNDAFLDRPPLDSLGDETFWVEEEPVKAAAVACYDFINKGNTLDNEYFSDNNLYFSNTDGNENVSAGYHNSFDPIMENFWASGYGAIRRCNTFLANYEKGTYDPDLKERLAAEVRFLRAYYYSQLITVFGDVQFVLKPLSPGDPEVYGTRQSKDDILEFVLTEFDEAAKILPVSYEAEDRGRATKGAAYAMEARVALFFGKWDVAERAAGEVMKLGYELYDVGNTRLNYYMLFRHAARPSVNTNNKEDIFWRPYLESKIHHNLSRELQLPTTRTDEYIRWSPTKSLVDSYLCTDGLPIDKSGLYKGPVGENPTGTYADYWRNRDPRMSQTILAPYTVVKEEETATGKPSGDLGCWKFSGNPFNGPSFPGHANSTMTRTGFYFCKYAEIGGERVGTGDLEASVCVGQYNYDWNDIRIIRYAEVLLIYAEACLEQDKLTQDVVDKTINLLRKRVGMHEMDLAELQANGMDVREEVRRERRVELALDGLRYFDLLRWRQGSLLAADKMGMNKKVVETEFPNEYKYVEDNETDLTGDMILFTDRVFNEDKHYLWPIPESQRILNKNLTQNPQW